MKLSKPYWANGWVNDQFAIEIPMRSRWSLSESI